jgi:hypothetical protein
MRRAIVLLGLCCAATAHADKDKKKDKEPAPPVDPTPTRPTPPPPGPDDAKVKTVLEKLEAAPDHASRQAQIDELDKLAPTTIDTIGTWLRRKHDVSLADRKKTLQAIKAAVPDRSGHFNTPERKSAKEEEADESYDWLAKLDTVDAKDAGPGLGEVLADDAAIRALAATRNVHAAQLIFDVAFDDETIIYRDECGRYLRRMGAYNLPALIIESESGTNYDRRRYATYQLERMDRQEPTKAVDATKDDENLTVALMDAFKEVHHREAVHVVWAKVDADSTKVRAAARDTWLAYVTGPPPPPAPRRHLQMTKGKMTAYAKPLWLTYRELADNELRRSANELLHEEYPLADPSMDDNGQKGKTVDVNVEELTKRLFTYFDDARAKKDADQWAAAKTKADAGELAVASQMIDRLLAMNPDRAERPAMAKVYLAYGVALEGKQQWADASAAYAKAAGLDPKGAGAKQAEAGQHYAQGKALDAAGKDGGPDFRRAVALGRADEQAQKAASDSAPVSPPKAPGPWLLYAAVAAGVVALMMFAVAMRRRRA